MKGERLIPHAQLFPSILDCCTIWILARNVLSLPQTNSQCHLCAYKSTVASPNRLWRCYIFSSCRRRRCCPRLSSTTHFVFVLTLRNKTLRHSTASLFLFITHRRTIFSVAYDAASLQDMHACMHYSCTHLRRKISTFEYVYEGGITNCWGEGSFDHINISLEKNFSALWTVKNRWNGNGYTNGEMLFRTSK